MIINSFSFNATLLEFVVKFYFEMKFFVDEFKNFEVKFFSNFKYMNCYDVN